MKKLVIFAILPTFIILLFCITPAKLYAESQQVISVQKQTSESHRTEIRRIPRRINSSSEAREIRQIAPFENRIERPHRDDREVLSYHDEENLEFFVNMPNDWDDHGYNVRFTAPETPFQVISIEVLLFDIFGMAGEPGMIVGVAPSENGFPGEVVANLEIDPEELILNDGEGREWTEVDLEGLDIVLEENEDFHVIFDVAQFDDEDTLAIFTDNGEQQPTDRSGFFSGENEDWLSMEDAYGVGLNLAVRATVEFGLEERGELELSAEEYDYRDVEVGELADWTFTMTNIGAGYLDILDVDVEGERFFLEWNPPDPSDFEPWDLRLQFPAGEIVEDNQIGGIVYVNGFYYVSGGNNGEAVNNIYVFNEEGELGGNFEQFNESRSGMLDMTWDGELIWGGDEGTIYGFTSEGELVTNFEGPLDNCSCIAWDVDRELLWVADAGSNIFGIDREGNLVAEIEIDDMYVKEGLSYWRYDPDDADLYIFSSIDDGAQEVNKLDIETGEVLFVRELGEDIEGPAGGIHIAPIVDDLSWIFAAIIKGEQDVAAVWQMDLMPGLPLQASTEATVTFAPRENGERSGRVFVTVNDPDNFQSIIELTGEGVGGRNPMLINVPDDFITIQAAIDTSINGDTVLVQPGIYLENINFLGKSITVGSLILTIGDEAYIDSTIIDGGGLSCAVAFNHGEDSLAVLRGFTIRNGIQNFGGGIDCQDDVQPQLLDLLVTENTALQIGAGIYCTWNSKPRIERVRIINNEALDGAGIGFAHAAHPILTDVVIRGNRAQGNGGGLFAGHGGGECSLYHVTIDSNTANYGGGAYYTFSDNNTLDDVIIRENTAASGGGGLYCYGADPLIENCTIANNAVTDGVGGGIMCEYYANPTFIQTTIRDNSAQWGGGIHSFNHSNPQLERCFIYGNNASVGGGGVDCSLSAYARLVNVTLTENNADSIGGAITMRTGSVAAVLNSILWHNGEQCINLTPDLGVDTILVAYSVVEGGQGAIQDNGNGLVEWSEGNLDSDPAFVNPQERDFQLDEESPCIDAGTAFFAWGADTLINLGRDEYYGEAPDMGAHEVFIDAVVDDSWSNLPDQLILYPNYPNPFNSVTKIGFELLAAGRVRLQVFDITGREVATIAEEWYLAGRHVVTWDANDLQAGLYLVKLTSNSESVVQKIVLIK